MEAIAQPIQLLAMLLEAGIKCLPNSSDAAAVVSDQIHKLGNHLLRSSGWGMGRNICGQIGQRLVSLMPNAGYQRQGAIGYGPHNPLIIEALQIFGCAPAPRQNDHLGSSISLHAPDSSCNGFGGLIPLNDRG